jgi:hypothetical protein
MNFGDLMMRHPELCEWCRDGKPGSTEHDMMFGGVGARVKDIVATGWDVQKVDTEPLTMERIQRQIERIRERAIPHGEPK